MDNKAQNDGTGCTVKDENGNPDFQQCCDVFKRGPLTDSGGKPFFLDVVRVPNALWKVCGSLVDVYKLDEFGVEMGIAEGTVGHE